MWRLLRYLIGPDVFISYARKDAGAYADRLTERLKSQPGISVYLDQEQAEVGKDLPKTLLRHLRLSRRMVAIITDASKQSAMKEEVNRFAETPRKVIPIDARETSERPDWDGLTGAFWRTESVERLRAGDPSDAIVQEVLDAIGADRQSRRTRRAALLSLAFIVLAAIVSYFMIDAARRQRAIADARALLFRGDDLLRNDPKQRDRAVLMATAAVRRLEDADADAVAAAARLRILLEESGTVRKRFAFRGPAYLAAPSHDGRFAAAAHERAIELWDAQSGKVRALPVAGRVSAIRFSADGSHVAAVFGKSRDERSLSIWRTNDGARVASRTTDFAIVDAALSADGALYAIWSGGAIRVYRTETGVATGTELHPEDSGGAYLSFSRNAELLGASGRQCRVWRIDSPGSGRLLWTSANYCMDLAFSDDGTIAVSSGNEGVTARALSEERDLWTSAEGRAVSIERDRIAVAQREGVEVRDLRSGNVERHFPAEDPVQVTMKDGVIAALLANDTSVIFQFDRVVHTGHSPMTELALASDGRVLFVTAEDAILWDGLPDSSPYWRLSRAVPDGIGRIAISSAKRQLAAFEELPNHGGSMLRIYDLRTFRPVVSQRCEGASAVAFHEGTLVFGTAGGEVFTWNGKGFRPLQRPMDPDRTRRFAIRDVRIDRSGRFAAASTSVELFVWRMDEPRAPLLRLAFPKGTTLEDFAFGRSHEEIVTIDSDQMLQTWRWTSSKSTRIASVKSPDARSIVVIGDSFVASDENDAIVLRSLDDLNAPPVARMAHGAPIMQIAAAGDLIVSAGEDGFLRVWSWKSGKPAREVAQIRVAALYRNPDAIAVDPAGRLVASAQDTNLEVRQLDPRALWRASCARLAFTRNTPELRDACAELK